MDAMESHTVEPTEPIASGRSPKKLTPPSLKPRHIDLANRLSIKRRPFAFNIGDAVLSFDPRGLGSIPSKGDGADLVSIGLYLDGTSASICLRRSLFERIIEKSDPDLLLVDPNDDLLPLLYEASASDALSAAEAGYQGRIELSHVKQGIGSQPRGLDLLFELGLDGAAAGMASLRIDESGAERLAKIFANAPKVRSIDQGLKAELSVRAGTVWLSTGELRSLRPGDVLIADDNSTESNELAATLGETWLLNAKLSKAGLTLTKPLRPATAKDRELWMMDDNKQPMDAGDELDDVFENGRDDRAPDKARQPDSRREKQDRSDANAEPPPSGDMPYEDKPDDARFDEVPIKLVFEVGRTEINLGRLQEIGPGHVFQLDRPVGEAVEVFAGGRRIGQGEIVAIGEQAGVRMVRLFGHD